MFLRRSFFITLLFVCAFAVSCTHVPTDEMEEARLALKDAAKKGAPTYASKEYESAQEEYDKANNSIAEQNYEKAYKHAKNATELAYLARRIAEEKAKQDKAGAEEKVSLREDEQAKKPVGNDTLSEGEGVLSAEAAEILSHSECKDIKTIYFDFDQFSLRPDAIQAVQVNLACIKLGEFTFSLEGHCDERGSNEYNLALGKRRAESVRDYLIQMGINQKRIETVSFGEEKPVALGKNETAWAQNRRVEFIIK